jgi:hypothetical protein
VSERVSPTMVRDVLRTARDIMIERGLSQGAPARAHDGEPLLEPTAARAKTISIVSAITVAARRLNAANREVNVAVEKFRDACGAGAAPNPTWSVSDWADVEGRTAAQVVEAFNKAIANTMPALSRRAVGG